MPTLVVNEVVNEIRRWLHILLPGGIMWGLSRVGKTHIARCLLGQSEALFGASIPIALISVVKSDKRGASSLTEKRFYTELLIGLGSKAPQPGTAIAGRQRLLGEITDQIKRSGENRFMLIIDEAQWLTDQQYSFLVDLNNQLRLLNVAMITVLIGQPELAARKMEYIRERQGHIVGRFMIGELRIKGVASIDSLAHLCRAMDSMSEYPPGSGISFTCHFVPRAFEAGWRLEAQAEQIWGAFEEVCRRMGARPFKDLQMSTVIAVLRALLLVLQEREDLDPELDDGFLRTLIMEVAWPNLSIHIEETYAIERDHGKRT